MNGTGKCLELAFPLVFLGLSLSAYANERTTPCSNSTIRGDYAFSINGGATTPGGVFEIHGVALTHFDGQGNLTNSDHLVRNGTPPLVDWRPGTGTYVVHENCTGELHINNEGRPTLDLYFVIANGGHELRCVVSDPGANISANGRRVHIWS
jgi:hypothetical protein